MKKYYHISSVDHVEILYLTTEERKKQSIYNGNIYGPFYILAECKKDATDYHRATVKYARLALCEIRNTRKGDLE